MTIEKLIPTNEHPIERGIRIVIGLVALALVFVGPKTYWGLLGLLPLVTGILGSCPAYTLFGISTCRMKRGTGRADTSVGSART